MGVLAPLEVMLVEKYITCDSEITSLFHLGGRKKEGFIVYVEGGLLQCLFLRWDLSVSG